MKKRKNPSKWHSIFSDLMVKYERWLGVETKPAIKTAHGIRSSDFACLHIVTLAVSVGGVGSSTGQRSDGLFYWCVMNYYAFHIGDYKAHTQHLTPMEDLIYRRMLDLYYLNESPLPDAQKIARSICLRDHISDIETILSEFFISTPEGHIHARCERELKAMNEKSGKAKASAQARWNAVKQANNSVISANQNVISTNDEEKLCERNANASEIDANASFFDANAMRNGCEGNAPNTNTNPNTKTNTSSLKDLAISTCFSFDDFWRQYPNKAAKQNAAKAWSKIRPDETLFNRIMRAVMVQKTWRQWQDGFTPHAATWLNGRRWEDEPPPDKRTGRQMMTGADLAQYSADSTEEAKRMLFGDSDEQKRL